MFQSKFFWYPFAASAIIIWIFIIYGLIYPISNEGLYYTWLTMAILFPVAHIMEIKKSIPVGKEAGHSTLRIVLSAFFFGIAYRYPVTHGIYKK